MSSRDRSEASQSMLSADLIDDARPGSDTPSFTDDFFEALERLSSRRDWRCGLRTP